MAFFRGEDGSVLFDNGGSASDTVAGTTSWNLSISKEVLETTALGAKSRNYTGSLISATGRVELVYTKEANTTASSELINDILVDAGSETEASNAQFKLYLDTANTKGFTFDAIITSAEFGATVGDLQTVSCGFTVCGDITHSLE